MLDQINIAHFGPENVVFNCFILQSRLTPCFAPLLQDKADILEVRHRSSSVLAGGVACGAFLQSKSISSAINSCLKCCTHATLEVVPLSYIVLEDILRYSLQMCFKVEVLQGPFLTLSFSDSK